MLIIKTKEWLKEAREKADVTQKELAEAIQVSVPTIANIEQGQRLGSVETWEKINYFFEQDGPCISFASDELIKTLQNDIENFGADNRCRLFYKKENNYIVFNEYVIIDDKPLNSKLLSKKYIETTLNEALKIFEEQNSII